MNSQSTIGLDTMIEGYRRFRVGGWDADRARWASLREGQSPATMVIACSDSRVDPSHIFDCAPGEIFVVRNVAALVPPYETTPGQHGVSAALEFAVEVLGVGEIMVMGHGLCGGCEAALTRSMEGAKPGDGGFVAQWISLLDAAREEVADAHGTDSQEARRAMELAAIRVSLANLRSFPNIREKEAAGSLALHGAFFAISDGVLHLLDEESDAFQPIA